MASDANILLSWIGEQLAGINFFTSGTNFIAILVIGFVLAYLISVRKPSNLKITMFPVMLGLRMNGFNIPMVFIGIGAIVFAMETLSLRAIGDGISAAVQRTSETIGSGIKFTLGRQARRDSKFLKEAKRKAEVSKYKAKEASDSAWKESRERKARISKYFEDREEMPEKERNKTWFENLGKRKAKAKGYQKERKKLFDLEGE